MGDTGMVPKVSLHPMAVWKGDLHLQMNSGGSLALFEVFFSTRI